MSDLPVSQRARDAAAEFYELVAPTFPNITRAIADKPCALARAFAAFERDCTAPYREALTPSSDTKAAYIGEVKDTFVQYDEFGDEQYCTRPVSWTATKEIMAMISARAALQHGDSSDG